MTFKANNAIKLGKVIPFIQNGDYFYQKGISFYRKNNMDRAIYYLEKAIELKKDDPVYHCQLSAILADKGEYERSNEILDYVISELDPTMYECYFFMANNYAHLGLFEKAEELAFEYIEKNEDQEFLDDCMSLIDLLCLEKEDNSFETRLDEEELLIIRHENAAAHIARGHYELAIDQFKKMIEDRPNLWSAHNQIAKALFLQGQHEEAFERTFEVLENDPGNFTAYCHLTTFYFETGEKEKAYEFASWLTKISPIDIEQRFLLAETLCKIELFKESFLKLRLLKKDNYHETADFLRCYAVAAYHCEEKERAYISMRKAARLGDQKAKEFLADEANGLLKNENVRYN
ncbi:tetratricopeptide repeat protein [Alkalihalobacterium chitinilyticum]|uniref:Tetratricopeptide repeat protein n=1 Tax=Alkalihalobacterium chitinilyticum TaxID=2980103 RepID=A0ABT5VFQ0_9BACI|nr:tetratricopeptide repeat protein [Alkalihalobacterium chitinilyticum]MDE5414105.1 tetratricopeptide repeat protein [Alkalihalobacterium chitinilyticum]